MSERMRCFLINPVREGPWSFQPQFADWFRETIVAPALAEDFDIREPDEFLNHHVTNKYVALARAIQEAELVVADFSHYWFDLHTVLGAAVAEGKPVVATMAADVAFPFSMVPKGMVIYGRYELDDVPVAVDALRRAVEMELREPKRCIAAWVNELVKLQRKEQASAQAFSEDWLDTYWSMRCD